MSGKKKKKKANAGLIAVLLFSLVSIVGSFYVGVILYSQRKVGEWASDVSLAWIFFALIVLIGYAIARVIKQERAKVPSVPELQIVRTKLMAVNGVNGTYRRGTVSGAIVGGMLGGGLGALIGAAANTQDRQYNIDNKYTFLVIYDDDTQKLETVSERHDKKRFDLLVSKLDIDS